LLRPFSAYIQSDTWHFINTGSKTELLLAQECVHRSLANGVYDLRYVTQQQAMCNKCISSQSLHPSTVADTRSALAVQFTPKRECMHRMCNVKPFHAIPHASRHSSTTRQARSESEHACKSKTRDSRPHEPYARSRTWRSRSMAPALRSSGPMLPCNLRKACTQRGRKS